MSVTILSVPLQRLTAIDAEITAGFVQALLKDIPNLGKEAERHFILNTNLTIFNPNNLKHIHIFNMFLEVSRRAYTLIQFTKL